MAQLNFNLIGYSFQHGLEVLRKSLGAALDGLQGLDAQARAACQAYDEHVAAGGAPIGEWTDEGERVWGQDQVLAYEAEIAGEAAEDLTKAYVIALYHHWERWARLWSQLPRRGDFDALTKATLARGYPVHAELHLLKEIANVLKHQKAEAGAIATTAWPDLAPTGLQGLGARIDWYASIRISPARMATLFDIVASSGPTTNMMPQEACEPTAAAGG